MALWIFGCSFSVEPEDDLRQDWPAWPEILAKKLGLDEYHNHAEWGVSNEFIVDKFMNNYEKILPGDHVIIQLTERSRQWFFKDQPSLGNLYITDLENHVNKDQAKAVEMYIKYLDRDEIQNIRYALVCMALKHISVTMAASKIMVIPGFNYIPGVVGTLLDICNGEFKSAESCDNWYKTHPIDIRINHMSKENHQILADKIFHCFNTGSVLDLTSEFKTEFL